MSHVSRRPPAHIVLGTCIFIAHVCVAVTHQRADRFTVVLDRGSVTGLHNHLTDERLSLNPPHTGDMALLWRKNPWLCDPESAVETHTGMGVRFAWRTGDGTHLDTYWQPEPGQAGLAVLQAGESPRSGLHGVHLSLRGLPSDQVTVIVPGLSGIALGERPPVARLDLPWPVQWEAGMVLLQTAKGGFLIWADDPDQRFKTLRYRHADGRTDLVLESSNHAPFDDSTATESVRWRIRAYRGDWRVGTGVYRDWMARTFGLSPLHERRPGWSSEIRFLAITGPNEEILAPLARHVDPQMAMLYLPDWRTDRYDVSYPDYTPRPEIEPFVRAAHRHGFRVMLHVNYFGCDLKHPLYERFERHQLRAPHTDQRLWWVPPLQRDDEAESAIKFAYIHPGSSEWRRLLVSRWRELVATTGVDSLHLDQTLVIPNHNRGRVDGMTVPEGNRALHRELREALPNVALSGEGLNEVSIAGEAFAQRHAARAVDHVHKTWDDRFAAVGHPISSYLFLPYCTINGYLGMSNPREGGVFGGWMRAYANWGVIPTLARPSIGQLEHPDPPTAMLLELAGLWMKNLLVPDLDTPWGPDVLFRHRGLNVEATLTFARDAAGQRCTARGEGKTWNVYRYVHGVSSVVSDGSIPGWGGHDSTRLIGLDPNAAYLLLPEPRNPSAPHISAVPEGVHIKRLRQTPGLFAVSLADIGSERWFDFSDAAPLATTGLLRGGDEAELGRGASFHAMHAACGTVRRKAILAHPPWHAAEDGGPLGETFGEYRVDLPADRRPEMRFFTGLRTGVNGRSDGVTYRVVVQGQEVWRAHAPGDQWEPHRIDLTPFAGQSVRIRLITGNGPDGNPAFDWALWGDPVIALESPDTPRSIVYTAAKQAREALGTALPGTLTVTRTEEGLFDHRLQARIPGTVLFTHSPAHPVTGPADLATLPFSVNATVEGRSATGPLQHVGCAPGQGTSAGDERACLAAHPPNNGRTYADFLLRLPDDPLVLRTEVALQDGSLSDACRFRIQINGETVADRLLTGPDGWHALEAPLVHLAGRLVLVSLVVDSEGSFYYDWARWGRPRLADHPQ